jgi:hypothetical protein
MVDVPTVMSLAKNSGSFVTSDSTSMLVCPAGNA